MSIWGTPKFGRQNSSKVEKEKLTFWNRLKLPSVTLLSKLNIESENIKAVNKAKNLSIFLWFC